MVLTPNAGNFPMGRRGTIIAAILACAALSALVWTLVYQYALYYNVIKLCAAFAVSSSVATLIATFLVADLTDQGNKGYGFSSVALPSAADIKATKRIHALVEGSAPPSERISDDPYETDASADIEAVDEVHRLDLYLFKRVYLVLWNINTRCSIANKCRFQPFFLRECCFSSIFPRTDMLVHARAPAGPAQEPHQLVLHWPQGGALGEFLHPGRH